MSDFIKWSKKKHRHSTHRRYCVSEVALSRSFGRFESLDKITPDVVEKFKSARQAQFTTVRAKQHRKYTKQRVKPATVNRELACVWMEGGCWSSNEIPLSSYHGIGC
jgi:hypothetical protein